MCRQNHVGQFLVALGVFVINVCGWVLLFDANVGHCDPMDCAPEVLMLVIIQCAETVFLAFHFIVYFKSMWSEADWLCWGIVVFINMIVVFLEFYIAWQESAAFQISLHSTIVQFMLKQDENTSDWVRWFVTMTCLVPMLLFFYLVLRAIKQSDFSNLHPHTFGAAAAATIPEHEATSSPTD